MMRSMMTADELWVALEKLGATKYMLNEVASFPPDTSARYVAANLEHDLGMSWLAYRLPPETKADELHAVYLKRLYLAAKAWRDVDEWRLWIIEAQTTVKDADMKHHYGVILGTQTALTKIAHAERNITQRDALRTLAMTLFGLLESEDTFY